MKSSTAKSRKKNLALKQLRKHDRKLLLYFGAVFLPLIFVVLCIIIFDPIIMTRDTYSSMLGDEYLAGVESIKFEYEPFQFDPNDPRFGETAFRNDFEKQIIDDYKAGNADWEDVYFVVSGVDTQEEIDEYKTKLDQIYAGFQEYYKTYKSDYEEDEYKTRARAVLDYLYKDKGYYYSRDYVRFTEVIDNYLDYSEDKGIGQCVSLSAFYMAIAERAGIQTMAGRSNVHMIAVVVYEDDYLYIESTAGESGFDGDRRDYEFYYIEPKIAVATSFLTHDVWRDEVIRGYAQEESFYTGLYIQELPSLMNDYYQFQWMSDPNFYMAKQLVLRIEQDAPGKPWIYHTRCKAYRNINNDIDALKDCSIAVGLSNENDGNLLLERASVYYDLENYDNAWDDTTLARNKGVWDFNYWYLLYKSAEVNIKLNYNNSAVYYANLAIEEDPENGLGYYIKGRVYCYFGKYEEASALFDMAISYSEGTEYNEMINEERDRCLTYEVVDSECYECD